MRRMQPTVGIAAIAAAAGAALGQVPQYRVTLIDPVQTPGGAAPMTGEAINDLGWVVGVYGTTAFGSFGYRTALWKPGEQPQDIGHPGNLVTVMATDINNDGLIVGRASDALIGIDTRGYTWSWENGEFTVYPQFVPNRYAHPGKTNNAGRIIGSANDGSFIGQKAVEYLRGGPSTVLLMPEAPGYNTALDVNNLDVIMGREIRGAYLWFPGAPDRSILPAPPTLPYVTLYALNDRNDVIGEARQGGHSETTTAAVWLDGEGWRLIPRNGRRNRAVAINNRREVVGTSQDNTGALGNHGWYWTPETGSAIPLEQLIVDPPGVYAVSLAGDINEQGQIVVGLFVRATGDGHAAVLTPIESGAACYANCDESTVQPVLNVNDFVCFQTQFAAGASAANCDGSTEDRKSVV